MEKHRTIAFIGGDRRQVEAIKFFLKDDFIVHSFGLPGIQHENVRNFTSLSEELFNVDFVVLPIPYKNKAGFIPTQVEDLAIKPEEIVRHLKNATTLFLGRVDEEFINCMKHKKVIYFDILQEESFSILNAIPTAEGAIQIAMERTDITLHGSNALVLGYGRIGKVLSRMLKGVGANVTVEARKDQDLAWIMENGYIGVHLEDLASVLPKQDIIFNTVPHMILDRKKLQYVNSEALIIDLASYPGGVDFDAAAQLGIKASLELGLPGIVAPKTAGKIIYQVIHQLMKGNRK